MTNNIEIFTGNTKEAGADHRGWFVGNFMKPIPLRTESVEIKWSEHKEYNKKETPGESGASTLVVLMRGKEIIKFPATGQEVVLEKEGDFLLFRPNMPHNSEFFPNTLVMVIRWPSIPQV